MKFKQLVGRRAGAFFPCHPGQIWIYCPKGEKKIKKNPISIFLEGYGAGGGGGDFFVLFFSLFNFFLKSVGILIFLVFFVFFVFWKDFSFFY